jgi:hypothetical protein
LGTTHNPHGIVDWQRYIADPMEDPDWEPPGGFRWIGPRPTAWNDQNRPALPSPIPEAHTEPIAGVTPTSAFVVGSPRRPRRLPGFDDIPPRPMSPAERENARDVAVLQAEDERRTERRRAEAARAQREFRADHGIVVQRPGRHSPSRSPRARHLEYLRRRERSGLPLTPKQAAELNSKAEYDFIRAMRAIDRLEKSEPRYHVRPPTTKAPLLLDEIERLDD